MYFIDSVCNVSAVKDPHQRAIRDLRKCKCLHKHASVTLIHIFTYPGKSVYFLTSFFTNLAHDKFESINTRTYSILYLNFYWRSRACNEVAFASVRF